jgi:hypothetical protein
MADHADRLAGLKERAHESKRLRFAAQLIGVRDSARQDQGVVVGRIGLFDGLRLEGVAFVEVVESLDLARFRSRMSVSAPASRRAFIGSVNSTCSTPSLAIRKATRLPCRSSAIFSLLLSFSTP